MVVQFFWNIWNFWVRLVNDFKWILLFQSGFLQKCCIITNIKQILCVSYRSNLFNWLKSSKFSFSETNSSLWSDNGPKKIQTLRLQIRWFIKKHTALWILLNTFNSNLEHISTYNCICRWIRYTISCFRCKLA